MLRFPPPQDVIVLSSDSSADEAGEVTDSKLSGIFVCTVDGKPVPWPRPEFMAWLRNGKLFRRVVNKAKPQVKQLQDQIQYSLLTKYQISQEEFPLFHHEAVSIELTFYKRPPNSSFQGNNRLRKLLIKSSYDAMQPDIQMTSKFVSSWQLSS